jgi:hypothetical protein
MREGLQIMTDCIHQAADVEWSSADCGRQAIIKYVYNVLAVKQESYIMIQVMSM